MVKIQLLKEWDKNKKIIMYLKKGEQMISLLDFKNKIKKMIIMIMKEDQRNI